MEVFDHRKCVLGEGPIWHDDLQTLFWFDIENKKMLAQGPEGPAEWQFEEHHSAAGIIDSDTLLIGSETGLWTFHISTGERSLVCDLERDNFTTRSNDGRTDHQGGFWIGTMGKQADPAAGAIYRYYKGELRKLYAELTIPNAICFSPDGQYGYYTCTPTQKIMRQLLDREGWPDGPPEILVDLAPEGLFPDGAVVDADGGIWNAQWGAGRVARYTPEGAFDLAISVPGLHASCPAFGGPSGMTLFVTTAEEGLNPPSAADGLLYTCETEISGQVMRRIFV